MIYIKVIGVQQKKKDMQEHEPENVIYGLNIKKHDNEGRVITLEFEKFFLIACYTPNVGDGLKSLDYRIDEWDKDFFEFIKKLNKKKRY